MWSVRAVVEAVVEQSRRALHHLRHKPLHNPIHKHQHKLSKGVREGAAEAAGGGCVGGRAGVVASRLRPLTTQLLQSIFRKVPAPLWTEARRRTTQRLVFGASAPYFALVGVTLVGGSHGLVTRDDELEALCGIVREAISRAGWLHNPEFWESQKEDTEQQQSQQQDEEQAQKQEHEELLESGEDKHVFSLADFILGPVIDKGCNAAVYAARWKSVESSNHINHERNEVDELENKEKDGNEHKPEEGDEQPLSHASTIREVVQGLPKPQETVVGNLGDTSVTATFLQPEGNTEDIVEEQGKEMVQGAVARTPTSVCGPGKEHHGDKGDEKHETRTHKQRNDNLYDGHFPLAVKMMFNYEAESNAPAILRAMYREILPARSVQLDEEQQEWQERLCGPRVCLAPHPNIVDMPCVFVDRVPLLEGCLDLFPQALPSRLNPQGYGRNMSLFCVMNRYDTSLREYLAKHRPSQHTCLLLLTQLLEAILHLRNSNIAHRDLKSDNILLSLAEGWQYPLLVVSDFGCSLIGDNANLSVPFPSREADPRQGNPSLMAPEVKTAAPGMLSSVSFSQSDLWAVGTLMYEIYGLDNPFAPTAAAAALSVTSSRRKSKPLDSATYKESQLPRLPRSAPPWVRHLAADILRRNPRARPTVNIAATLCQLMLWAPSKWLNRHSLSLPTHTEVTQWLLCLSTKVLCEARLPQGHASHQHTRQHHHHHGKRKVGLAGNTDHQGSHLEYQIVSTFLRRLHSADIIQAIKWNRAF